jgi:SAM-dependent methyltransferase
MSARCAACGAAALAPHLAVAGNAGEGGLIPTTDQFGTALADIARCAVCGHMQLATMPSKESLSEAYGEAASSDYVEEEAGQRETARAVLDRIERHAPPGDERRLLDLGCWVGFLLSEANGRGWRGEGVEPSDFAAAYAAGELGLSVQHSDLFEAELEAGAYSAIVMADVIEHLLDPGAALQRCGELLAPAGVLALVLPDAGSALARAMGRRWWSVIPTHVQYFTRASLTRLLERNGFEVLEIATSPKAFTVRYYLERIGGYSRAVSGGLVALAERTGLADRMWAPDFRDRMIAIARPGTSRT